MKKLMRLGFGNCLEKALAPKPANPTSTRAVVAGHKTLTSIPAQTTNVPSYALQQKLMSRAHELSLQEELSEDELIEIGFLIPDLRSAISEPRTEEMQSLIVENREMFQKNGEHVDCAKLRLMKQGRAMIQNNVGEVISKLSYNVQKNRAHELLKKEELSASNITEINDLIKFFNTSLEQLVKKIEQETAKATKAFQKRGESYPAESHVRALEKQEENIKSIIIKLEELAEKHKNIAEQ